MIRTYLSPEQEIASDQLDDLRERTDWCADISVHAGNHPWVRWNGEAYEIARTGHLGDLEVETCDKEALLNLFAENPVHIMPARNATYSPSRSGRFNVWEDVDDRHESVTYTDRLSQSDTLGVDSDE